MPPLPPVLGPPCYLCIFCKWPLQLWNPFLLFSHHSSAHPATHPRCSHLLLTRPPSPHFKGAWGSSFLAPHYSCNADKWPQGGNTLQLFPLGRSCLAPVHHRGSQDGNGLAWQTLTISSRTLQAPPAYSSQSQHLPCFCTPQPTTKRPSRDLVLGNLGTS